MRVLILSQYYTPEPIHKPSELAQELRKRGHTVHVITGFPNYPQGKLYPGYTLTGIARETIADIPVVRTYEFPYHGINPIGRTWNYVSFMLSAVFGVLFTPACDVMYVWHPPLTVGIAAWMIARLKRIPFVYDVQDIWPESVILSGLMRHDSIFVRILYALEKFVYRRAAHVLAVTPGAKDKLISKGVPPHKISVLPNWVDDELFAIADTAAAERIRQQYGWNTEFIILFAGNIGVVQGLENVIDACKRLPPESSIRVVFVGDGTDKARLQQLVTDSGLTRRIQFIDQQPITQMPAFMKAANALLVNLKRSEITDWVIPSKVIAYLAAGMPILAAIDGAAAALISQIDAGIVVEPENSAALVQGMEQMRAASADVRADMGTRGQTYVRDHLTRQVAVDKYEETLRRVINP